MGFCTVRMIEQVILNLEHHGFLVNMLFLNLEWVSCDCYFFPIFISRRYVVLYFVDIVDNLFNFILAIFLLVFTAAKIRVVKFIAFKHLLRCDSYIVRTY